MKYRVHRFEIKMNKDQQKFEKFLNDLEGEVVSIVPHVAFKAFWVHVIDYFYVVEKIN